MKIFLSVFVVIQILFALVSYDFFWLKRQFRYQYDFRVSVEKENDKLKNKLNKCLCFAPEKQPLGYCQREDEKVYETSYFNRENSYKTLVK